MYSYFIVEPLLPVIGMGGAYASGALFFLQLVWQEAVNTLKTPSGAGNTEPLMIILPVVDGPMELKVASLVAGRATAPVVTPPAVNFTPLMIAALSGGGLRLRLWCSDGFSRPLLSPHDTVSLCG